MLNRINFTTEIDHIIHGYVMSDGYLKPNGTLQVHHSVKQTKFVNWLYNKLEVLRTSAPISDVSRLDPRNGILYKSKRFNTKSLLKEYHKIWYISFIDANGNVRYKKVLPYNLDSFFSPTFISLWFAGAGTKIIGSRGAKFEVTCWSFEERIRLKELFQNKYNLKVSLNRAGVTKIGTQQWALCINSPEYDQFRDLITQIDLIENLFPEKLHSKKIL